MANPRRPRSPSNSAQPLVFVNLSNPAAVESESVRRLVRSSATRHSHKDPDRKPKRSRKAQRGGQASKLGSPNISASSSRGESPSGDEAKTTESSGNPVDHLFNAEERAEIISRLERRPQTHAGDEPTQPTTSQSSTPPNNPYPVESEEWFPWVLNYYRNVYLPAGVSFLQHTPEEGVEFIEWFIREASTEPALFYMQLLSTCPPLLNDNQLRKDHVEWLRGKVVQSINSAISDASRASRPSTLLAVALIALHEHVYGDTSTAASIHGKAFARMLEIRGGTRTLDLPRIMWNILLWLDHVLSSSGDLDDTSKQLMACWLPPYKTP